MDKEIEEAKARLLTRAVTAQHIIGVARHDGNIEGFSMGGGTVKDNVRMIYCLKELTDKLTQTLVDTAGEEVFQERYDDARKHNVEKIVSDKVEVRKSE